MWPRVERARAPEYGTWPGSEDPQVRMLLLLSNTVKMLPMHGFSFLLRDEQPLLADDLEDDHADERLYVESYVT